MLIAQLWPQIYNFTQQKHLLFIKCFPAGDRRRLDHRPVSGATTSTCRVYRPPRESRDAHLRSQTARTSVTLYLAATSAAMHVSEWPLQNCRHDTQPLLGSPTKNGWHFSHRSPCGTEIQRLSSDGLGSVVQGYWLRLYSSGSAALVQCLRFRSKDQAR